MLKTLVVQEVHKVNEFVLKMHNVNEFVVKRCTKFYNFVSEKVHSIDEFQGKKGAQCL